MYRGLFNPRVGLSKEDFRTVGFLTAALVLRWNTWVHRRVERSKFTDEDVLHRSVSIDFTLPYWFHQERDTPRGGQKRQLVPLGLLRKGTLVNFSLADESGRSLPLLNTGQNRQVAEATLVAIGEQVIGDDMAASVRCDVRNLVDGDPNDADDHLADLYGRRDSAEYQRHLLQGSHFFQRVAEPLGHSFLALTMVKIGWHERRVLHVSYDESLWINEWVGPLGRFTIAGLGRPRYIWLMLPAVGDTDSYHFEVEAPEDLQVTARAGFAAGPAAEGMPLRRVPERAGSYQRAHIHFPPAEQGEEAVVSVALQPRASALVRAGFLSAVLTSATLVYLRLRFGVLNDRPGAAGPTAALLLAFPGLVSVYLARSGENAMTTNLLWPVRVLALVPGLAAFVGAAALVAGSDGWATKTVLWVMAGVAGLSAVFLGLTWLRLWRARRR